MTFLVWAIVIGGVVQPLDDGDGLSEFASYRACVLYAIRRTVEIRELVRDAGFNGPVEWRCVR